MSNPGPPGVDINGALLRELRQLSGDTLKAFAPKCGIGFKFLSEVELGKKRVSPPTFARICDALEIPRNQRKSMIKARAA